MFSSLEYQCILCQVSLYGTCVSTFCIGRLTDPEILERRYPVILNKFCLAEGSGGQGKFRGGEGVLR
jgi:N-methylhydantoinase B/oxoprolinase/acetone carboxylase alpha subunit